MRTEPIHPQYDVPRIPMRHSSWFIQMLMVLAVLILAGVVYGFWQISRAPAPMLEPAPGPESTQMAPTNEESLTGSRTP